MKIAADVHDFQVQLLADGFRDLFGDFNDAILTAIRPMLEWVEVGGGDAVVHEGGTDDDLYFIISGRLRAYAGEGPTRRFLNEMGRGETIGEVTFFTGAPRSATVVANRDAVLVRMTRASLEKLIAAYPQLTLNMARLIIERLNRVNSPRRKRRRPVNICLLPITPSLAEITAQTLGERLVAHCPKGVRAQLLTSEVVGSCLGIPGIANVDKTQTEAYRKLTIALNEMESRYDIVLYVPDRDPDSEWSLRCLRMADRILLLADATATPAVSLSETRYLAGEGRVTEAEQVLVLLHHASLGVPSQTLRWLAQRPAGTLAGHLHVRYDDDRDLARLARVQSGRAIGLVFGGGGVRSLAHLGVYKALREVGIEVDFVGGTGMGAVMGALVALDRPADELIAYAREFFGVNPTGDISLLPLTSLIKGRLLKEALEALSKSLAGENAGIEDTWKTFFCVASNYSKACETVLVSGNLAKSIRASCAVPGLLPPVPIGGDLMVDGGAFNNFPTDIMGLFGPDKIIGVNFARDLNREYKLDEIPGGWKLMSDQLTGRRRKYEVPSLMSILMNTSMLYSASREHAAEALVDLEFKLVLRSVGMLDWHKAEHAINLGYKRARKMLQAMTPEQLAPFISV